MLDYAEEIVEKLAVPYGSSYDISAMLDELKEHVKAILVLRVSLN